MKISLFIFLLLSFVKVCSAQKFVIKGSVTDSITNSPLAYSTVRLIEKNSTKLFIGTLTDTVGDFIIQNIPNAEYLCIINYIGYHQKTIPISNENKLKFIDLSKIQLSPQNIALQEIIVNGELKTVAKIDRVIYKVDSSDIANAVTSLDVMKKVPDLKVDPLSNSVSIKGNGSTLVLVNGVNREGYINVRSINPQDIAKIEVITNPSSGENSDIDGIINIILKEKPTKGFNTQVGVDYSPYKKSLEPFSTLQYGWEKVRLNFDYFFGYKGMDFEGTTFRKNLLNNNVYSSVYTCNNPEDYSHIFRTGIDYYLNKTNFINLSSDNRLSNSNKLIEYDSKNTLGDSVLNKTLTKDSERSNYYLGNYTLFYRKSFKKEGQEFTSNFNFHFMKAEYNEFYKDEIISQIDSITLSRLNSEIGEKVSYNLKLEYLHPFSEKLKLNTGFLAYYQSFTNSFHTNNQSQQSAYDNLRLNYYFDLFYTIHKINFRLGSKIETYKTFLNDSTDISQSKILPSFVISRKLNKTNNLKLSYRETAFYPSVWQLSPHVTYYDSSNASQGNSALKPQTFKKLEIGNTYRKDENLLVFSLYYSIMENMFTSIKYIDNNNFNLSKAENTKGKTRYGIILSSSLLLFDKIEIEPEINLFREFYNIENINNSFVCSFSFGYYLPKDFFCGIYSSFTGEILTVQGYTKPQYFIDLIYIQKKVLNGNASISIGYQNPFFKIVDENIYLIENVYESKTSRIIREGFLFRFNYFITKGKQIEMTKINKITEKDIK